MTISSAELERLRVRCQKLESQLAQLGVAAAPDADLPTDEQTDQLLALVTKRWPVLAPPAGRNSYSLGFRAATHFLNYSRRRDTPDTGAMVSYWTDGAEMFLRDRGLTNGITGRSFVAACVASGVRYTPLVRFPHDVSLGLCVGDMPKPTAHWRVALAAGKVIEPTRVEALRATEPLPVTIRGGGNGIGRISNYVDLDGKW